MVNRIMEVVVAVKDIDDALRVYADVFGLKPEPPGVRESPGLGVKSALLALDLAYIELIQPTVGPDHPQGGTLARFLGKRGEGLYGLNFEVDNVNKELKRLADKGVALIDKKARAGLPLKMGFLHPSATRGTLIGLVERGELRPAGEIKFFKVGILVSNLEEALSLYQSIFGFKMGPPPSGLEHDDRGIWSVAGCICAMLLGGDGAPAIELEQPVVGPDHPYGNLTRWMQRWGEGLLHHLAIRVDDVSQEAQRLRAKGVRMIEGAQFEEMSGRAADRVVMTHPKSTVGVIFEIVSERVVLAQLAQKV